jgi:AraC-like DNA-binding protein/mannose-6-phosphate isomerase-like protein (cupin superfamily)
MHSREAITRSAAGLEEPASYYQGIDLPDRWQVQNLILFLRRSAETLQQRNFSNRLHHRFVFIVVLKTTGCLHLEGESFRLEPGEGILVHPYQFHHYSDVEDTELEWLFLTFEIKAGTGGLECLRNRVLQLKGSCLQLLGEIVDLYQDASEQARPVRLLPRMDCLLGELVRLADTDEGETGIARAAGRTWFSAIEPKLRRGLDAGLSMAAIAASLGLSERSLRQRFKAEAGITLRDYRINHQLHRAVSLMRRPELPLKRIAELSGFQSPQSFSRFFRQVTGLSARDYRNRAPSDQGEKNSL